ncbi:MAG: pilus assembly protein [Pseudomonadota bacterium]
MTIFTQFIRDEDGAVTIDWVALTAGILLLGIATVYFLFENGVAGALSSINTTLSNSVDTGISTSFGGFE